jgi:site-specific DNA-methyltransferase (adenine-specific)
MNQNDFIEAMKHGKVRQNIISRFADEYQDNWQMVHTPYDIVAEMCDGVMEADAFLVLFSLEFLEVLVKERNIDPKQIMFVADTEQEQEFASIVHTYGVNTFLLTKEIYQEKVANQEDEFLYIDIINEMENTMKFNKVAVVGNPPYQINDGGHAGSAKPLYHKFVEAVIDHINPDFFSMIIPSRWMVGGKGLNQHRDRMMKDHRMKKIVHFAGVREVFKTMQVNGGVNYFLWEKEYDGKCEFVDADGSSERFLDQYDIIVQNNMAVHILDKVQSQCSNWMNNKVSSRKPFGLATNFNDWDTSGVKCISRGRKENFVNSSKFTDKNNIIGKWKVCMGKADSLFSTGTLTKGNQFILAPDEICTETYIVVNVFDTKTEAENFISYLKTKFFVFMLGLRVSTQDINKEKFGFVPDVIDYSIAWTDAELYKKYNLTKQQIAYIERKIKTIK